MDIARLNRRIDILEEQVTRDSFGGEDKKWIVKKTVWAYINPVSGTEYFKSQQVQAENTTTIKIRYNTSVSVLNRIGYQDKQYEIIGIIDKDTDHKVKILNCKEIVSYGI